MCLFAVAATVYTVCCFTSPQVSGPHLLYDSLQGDLQEDAVIHFLEDLCIIKLKYQFLFTPHMVFSLLK